MVFTKFGDTDFGFLTTVDKNNEKVFVVFRGDSVIGVFYSKKEAMNFIWSEYQKELDAELTKETFFEAQKEESEFITKIKNASYLEYLKIAPTPEPTPTSPTFKFSR